MRQHQASYVGLESQRGAFVRGVNEGSLDRLQGNETEMTFLDFGIGLMLIDIGVMIGWMLGCILNTKIVERNKR